MLQRTGLTVILLATCALCLTLVVSQTAGFRPSWGASALDDSMVVAQSAPATLAVR